MHSTAQMSRILKMLSSRRRTLRFPCFPCGIFRRLGCALKARVSCLAFIIFAATVTLTFYSGNSRHQFRQLKTTFGLTNHDPKEVGICVFHFLLS